MDAGTRELTAADGEHYRFDAGSFCLELLLTGGPGAYARFELLRATGDLAAWLADSRLALLAPLAAEQVRIRPAELREIKVLRDTLWSVARTVAAGGWPERRQIELINACAGPPPITLLDPDTGQRRWAASITGTEVLGFAAGDAIDLLDGRAGRLRECAAPDCQLLFLDSSRPGSRRWCSMQRCGNREKVRGYRARLDAAPD